MPQQVSAAILEEPNRIAIRQFDLPKIGPQDALLRVELAGVCGTDPTYYRGKSRLRYPVVLGHEIYGRIAEIGDAAAETYRVKPGDKVVVSPQIRCDRCQYCLSGYVELCESPERRTYGVSFAGTPPYLWGGYAEYMFITPRSSLYVLPDDLPPEAGVLVCAVLADSLQWVRFEGEVAPGDTVVIQGAGQQGLAAVIAAKESGASKIIITRRSKFDAQRAELAKTFGADHLLSSQECDITAAVKDLTNGKLADAVVDVTGSPEALPASLAMVRKQGVLVLASVMGGADIPLRTDRIVFRAIRVQGVLGCTQRAVRAALDLTISRKYPIEKMVSHKFPLAEAERALQAAGRQIPGLDPIKCAIVP